jgi:thiosulfate/3-mercaptopyruvate sulfurtransferase
MKTSQLISPQELNEQMTHDGLRIVDCRFDLADPSAGRRDYESAHIPGAVFMDLNEDLASVPDEATGRHPLPDVEIIEETIGRLGIDNSSSVVVYDGGNGAMAARAWWIFRWLGHGAVRLLDGGVSAWDASGFILSPTRVARPSANFVATVRNDLVISTSEICADMKNVESMNLFDARDATRFSGEHEPIDVVAGHIPGARNLPFLESLEVDGRWKAREQLRDLWERQLGGDIAAEWIAMCGSGVTACHLALSALEAGYREPRLYVGSWSEWIRDPARPIG